jgi:hypothetical protein
VIDVLMLTKEILIRAKNISLRTLQQFKQLPPSKQKLSIISGSLIVGLMLIRSPATYISSQAYGNVDIQVDGSNLIIGNRGDSPVIAVALDGTLLGIVSKDKYDVNSICNEYGEYGGGYSPRSMFNTYGTHGGRHSPTGAYNPAAQKPPLLVQGGKPLMFVTKNTNFDARIDPEDLKQFCIKN